MNEQKTGEALLPGHSSPAAQKEGQKKDNFSINIPSISLPQGGGALRSIDEKFSVNAANGSSSFSVPLPFPASRSGFSPSLSLSYNSGSGNSEFGLGWDIGLASIQRKTDKQLPGYDDDNESDVFVLAGAEDLVPALEKDTNGEYIKVEHTSAKGYSVKRYIPRVEGGFARIEKITPPENNISYWKVTSRDNTVTFFGRTEKSRIADPSDETKVYKWLPELAYDDKGNCIEYAYIKEDLTNVPVTINEKNRHNGLLPFTNLYLHRVRYGNKTPYYPAVEDVLDPASPSKPGYFFDVIFDYDDHDASVPVPGTRKSWGCRTDPFSDHRAGFEIRTYRLCTRILFFHTFKELNPGGIEEPTLVRSLDITYRNFKSSPSANEADLIVSLCVKGYERSNTGYMSASLPPMTFDYHDLSWSNEVKEISQEDAANAPAGLSSGYQWVDFYNEGVPGILTEQGEAWYYKSNRGKGSFSKALPVMSTPSLTGLGQGILQLQDIEANGKKYIVRNDAVLQGYYEQTDEQEWLPFRPFDTVLNVNLRDPNARFLDLNGDGIADLVISEELVFTCYTGKGTKGFEKAVKVPKAIDEEKGPAVIFADPSQTVFLADMNGDGLTDIVRIRNGEVCYWPHYGYGRFGAKITMENSPVFDAPDRFNPAYLHLADVSGTGATDILYLGKQPKAWFNLSGNSWSESHEIENFPTTELPSTVSVIDLLGNGTGCIVWSSPLPHNVTSPMRYIDLFGGRKPYIMSSYSNGFGKETSITYKSSAAYYLEDKYSGKPWITKLPFPVQCVEKVETKDNVTGARYTSSYRYRHGYYDHDEREFRGFGMVEQTDTEIFDDYVKNNSGIVNQELQQAPVLTRTWYHTGAFIGREKILDMFSDEYYSNTSVSEHVLPQPLLDDELSMAEWRQALRACKGMTLRQEIYALDGDEREEHPYSVAEHNCCIQMLQPMQDNRHAVFIVKESEAISYYYERDPSDPRISHSLNIKFDELGNVLQSATIVYGRKTKDTSLPTEAQDEQARLHIIFTENEFTNDIDTEEAYRLRLPCQGSTYEITRLAPAGNYFTAKELEDAFTGAGQINYEAVPSGSELQKRKIEHNRILYYNNDADAALVLGTIESLGLPYEQYKLGYTKDLIAHLYDTLVTDAMLKEGGYLLSDDHKTSGLFPAGDNNGEWWVRSGTASYPASPQDHFYMPVKYTDGLGSTTEVLYYSDYHLFIEEVKDKLGNTTKVEEFDFRKLAPRVMADMNGSRSEVAVDILGFVTGMAISGNQGEGDSLSGFSSNLTSAEIADFFNDPETNAAALLGNATIRYVYDFSGTNGISMAVAAIARETHYSETLVTGKSSALQMSFEYSDGMGSVVMKKVQAEPGIAKQLVSGIVTEVDTSPKLRWIGNGRTVRNNKGKPIKQFEPYFSATHAYEDAPGLVEIGVSPVMYYDPIGRLVRTELPNGTFTKVEFDAWSSSSFDANDTVKDSDWYSDRTTGALAAITEEVQAASKAAVHYNTPAVSHLDSLGRAFYVIGHNKWIDRSTGMEREEFYETFTEYDVEGNPITITDARGNTVMEYMYDMLGNIAYQLSMDAGERRVLNNCMGHAMYKWDAREAASHFVYDDLHRPVRLEVTEKGKAMFVARRTVYGESVTNADQLYLRGKIYEDYDGAGKITNDLYDFKGNLLEGRRQLTEKYDVTIDWADINAVSMGDEYGTSNEYDALKRPVKIQAPDSSIIEPAYDKGSMLKELWVSIKGAAASQFVKSIVYNEKGQRRQITYGNDVATAYTYDDRTFRVTRIHSSRPKGSSTETLQDLNYTYDAIGNITYIKDNAQDDIYFNNSLVKSHSDYTYDAIYRLLKATGREHAGQNKAVSEYDSSRSFSVAAHPHDGSAMQNYEQHFDYDEAGNMLKMVHNAGIGSFANKWTRSFEYAGSNNRLEFTQVGSEAKKSYAYDAHGNMETMPHLSSLAWNYADQLINIHRHADNTERDFDQAWYQYDSSGNRVRKVVIQGSMVEERIYLGGWEVYKKTNGSSVSIERETLHILDGTKRIAMVDTKVTENDTEVTEEPVIRYQLDNHLGTGCIELDENAHVISYEEYYPFGCSSYKAVRTKNSKDIEVPEKRYRYTGKERDEESGLYYHGARYYAPWLARWTAADPIGIKDGLNVYRYCSDNPIIMNDPSGQAGEETAVVKPYVLEVLKNYNIPYATEVQFTMVDGKNVITGQFDLVIIDPTTKNPLPIELKGLDPDAFSTPGQEFYIKQFETPKGAGITITGSNAKSLGLKPGDVMQINESSFMRVFSGNMGDFADAVGEATGGKKVLHKFYSDKEGWKFFSETDEFREFLTSRGIDPDTGGVLSKKAVVKEVEQEVAQEVGEKILKEGGEELVEKGAKYTTKKVFSFFPIGGIAGEAIFKDEETGWGEVLGRGVGSEIGIGPLDLTTAYDIGSVAYEEGVKKYEELKLFVEQTPTMLDRMIKTNSTPLSAEFYMWYP